MSVSSLVCRRISSYTEFQAAVAVIFRLFFLSGLSYIPVDIGMWGKKDRFHFVTYAKRGGKWKVFLCCLCLNV